MCVRENCETGAPDLQGTVGLELVGACVTLADGVDEATMTWAFGLPCPARRWSLVEVALLEQVGRVDVFVRFAETVDSFEAEPWSSIGTAPPDVQFRLLDDSAGLEVRIDFHRVDGVAPALCSILAYGEHY